MADPLIRFPVTQWTRLETEGASAEGREWFCESYRPAVLAYLRTRYGHHEAEDLCQEFFSRVVLEQNLVEKADRHRGRLRSYLRGALDHFLASNHRKRLAKKRGGGAVHESLEAGESSGGESTMADPAAVAPDLAFDRAWAAALLDRALAATADDCGERDRLALFVALRPILDGSGPVRPHADIAAEVGLRARDVTLALAWLRRRVARHLYDEVARTVAGTHSVSDEWESVRQALDGW